MIQQNFPRIMIAGTNSGSGKTTVTCAILQLLKEKGLTPSSFKCGPDYIDPMFHAQIIGTKSRNLDAFFCEENTLKYLLAENTAQSDLAVIEGVMGFYDGMGLSTTTASAYHLSQITKTPVILVVNCKGLATSVLAIIQGFTTLYPDNLICGVLLNNVTPHTYAQLKPLIESHFSTVKVVGYLPKLPQEAIFHSRHLGLVTADEIADLKQRLQILSQIAAQTIDIDLILQLAQQGDALSYQPLKIPVFAGIRIGVSYDAASCFYYHDNLSLLQKMGAKLCYFSPLKDTKLPCDLQGLYIGGGYPELHLEALSRNKGLLQEIKKNVQQGMPLIAECGGFMMLTKDIEEVPMAQIFDSCCFNTGKLSRFGYVTLTALKNNLLCKKGETIKAHEFHYYDTTQNGEDFIIKKQNNTTWKGGFATDTLYAGFPHIHFYQNIKLAERFYHKCMERL